MFAVLTESASRFNSALFLKPNLMLPERMLSTQLGKNLPFAAVDLLHVTFSFFFFSSLLLFSYDSWIPQIVKFASSFRFKYVWHDSEITFILCCISHPHTPKSSNTHLRILLQLTKKHKWDLYCNKLQLFRSYLKAKPVEHRPPPSKYTAGHSIGTGFKGIAPPTEPLLQLPAFHPGNSLDQLLTKTTAFAK